MSSNVNSEGSTDSIPEVEPYIMNDAATTRPSEGPTSMQDIKMGSRVYKFRKPKPPPGEYPKLYSPYVMYHAATTAVSVVKTDAKNDLRQIHNELRKVFVSQYFDEDGVPEQTAIPRKVSARTAMSRRQPVGGMRRETFGELEVPMTSAEARCHLKRAIRESRRVC